MRSHGKHLCITIVDEPGLPYLIKQVDPEALIFYRQVWSAYDPSPRDGGWKSGLEWFERFWPIYAQIPGVDVWIFTNEWVNNDWPQTDLERLRDFWLELLTVCRNRGILCTVGDFSVGTPSDLAVAVLRPVFVRAEAQDCYLNDHCYSSQRAEGNTDMAFEAEWFAMRWLKIIAGIETMKVLGGETGNSGGNGLFRTETPRLMVQYADMVKPFRQYVSGNWWEITGPGTGWERDDWTPILPWYWQWCVTR